MSHYKLLVILALILNTISMNYALKTEELVGGYPAYQANHKHHAAIIGKYNKSNTRHLLCSGAIISDFFILSAANCVIGKSNSVRKFSFFVLLGSITLKSNSPPLRAVFKIFTFMYDFYVGLHDLAMLQLNEGLRLLGSDILASVKVPDINERFEGLEGFVAGYGSKTLESALLLTTKTQQRLTEVLGTNLTYAFARISTNEVCGRAYGYTQTLYFSCGVMKPDVNYRRRGICKSDSGAPLIYDSKVVGIAAIHNLDCDDTRDGSLYTKTSYYKHYIDSVLSGNPLNGTKYFYNPEHVW